MPPLITRNYSYVNTPVTALPAKIKGKWRGIDPVGSAKIFDLKYCRGRYSDSAQKPVEKPVSFFMKSAGRIIELKAEYGERHWLSSPDRKQRGKIVTLSDHSRSRMIKLLCRINFDVMGLPSIITITWPNEWPYDPKEWKNKKRALERRLKRKLGKLFKAVWRLEPQERGAPHFSYLVFGCNKFFDTKKGKKWLSKVWYEVVGSGDVDHLKAGTHVEVCRDIERVQRYISKYQSKKKKGEKLEYFEYPVGRYWGHIGELVLHDEDVRQLEGKSFYQLRRVLRGLYKAKKRAYGGKRYKLTNRDRLGGLWQIMLPQTIYRIREVYFE